jgi:hypothetical protein
MFAKGAHRSLFFCPGLPPRGQLDTPGTFGAYGLLECDKSENIFTRAVRFSNLCCLNLWFENDKGSFRSKTTTMNSFYSSLLVLIIALIPALPAAGQDNATENDSYKHAVGIGAGFVTGYGLSYRFQPKKPGFQLNFAPYKDDETARFSTGLTFFYPLIPGKVATLFVYQGNHYYYTSETVYTPDNPASPNPTLIREKVVDSYFNNGLGIGMEIVFAKRIGFNLMMGYAAYANFTKVNLTGETGLYFKF